MTAPNYALTLIEIDVDRCSLTYGTSPCTASIPATGTIKCHNGLGTCQDRANFANVPVTLRFAVATSYLVEAGVEVEAASIESVSYSPAVISLGEDLGQRSSLTVTFRDHRHSDTGPAGDKYLSDRDYNPYELGTYWGKFRTRNPFLRGRSLRFIQGLLGQALEDMDTRHFVIESFDGPNLDGTFSITAKDVLKLADADRAQAPLLSPGFLSGAIDDNDMAFTLTPAGIGNSDYPASGTGAIGGDELVTFTRSGDSVTITARAQHGTDAQAHSAGARFQVCLVYDAEDPADVVADLDENFAHIPSAQIPLAAWQAETGAYYRRLVSAVVAEPTGVKKLQTELIQQCGLAIWPDDVENQIRLQVLREISTDAELFDDSNIVAGSLRVTEQPEKRISQVWVYFGLKSPLLPIDDPTSYRSCAILVDLDAEEDYGQPAIKKIYSRWIPSGGLTIAQRVAQIQLGRYVKAPRAFRFSLFRRGAETPVLGEGCRLQGLPMQDATGAYENVPIQITRLRPGDGLWDVEAAEMLFNSAYDEGDGTPTVIFDANENNVDLLTRFEDLFPAATHGDTVEFYINAGVIIGSTSTSVAAMTVGNWPTLLITGNRTSGSPTLTGIADTTGLAIGQRVFGTGIPAGAKILSIVPNTSVTLTANASSGSSTSTALTVHSVVLNLYLRGRVQGKGGAGGDGGYAPPQGPSNHQDGFPGSPGGPALYTRYSINLFIDTGDAEVFGGGGGGGGSTYAVLFSTSRSGPGGGGGAGTGGGAPGVLNNANGLSVAFDVPGAAGTSEAGGRGGYSTDSPTLMPAGDGGGPGLPGAAGNTNNSFTPGTGGAAGTAIDGVSYVDKTGAGDIRGSETN